MRISLSLLLSLGALTAAWLPTEKRSTHMSRRKLPQGKIRGVNLGSWLVAEPWMMKDVWSNVIGCEGQASEFDCVLKIGQDKANVNFPKHWSTWVTQADLNTMKSYGLNTLRIPVGYWINESLKLSSEHFPDGGLAYLQQLCGWAADLNFYIIIDLHGAPYAQATNPFTGQLNPNPGFYSADGYSRAETFWQWMVTSIHTDNRFRTVGMVGVVNEPLEDKPATTASMISDYYPAVLRAIRQAEDKLKVPDDARLHVQYMDALWRAGNPKQNLPSDDKISFSDHNYIKYDKLSNQHQADYIAYTCYTDNRGADGDFPKVVDEFSLSVADSVQGNGEFQPNAANADFYSRWFSAQIQDYEKQLGWVFWAWRADLGDYRWSYKDAVPAGVIPKDLDTAHARKVCN